MISKGSSQRIWVLIQVILVTNNYWIVRRYWCKWLTTNMRLSTIIHPNQSEGIPDINLDYFSIFSRFQICFDGQLPGALILDLHLLGLPFCFYL